MGEGKPFAIVSSLLSKGKFWQKFLFRRSCPLVWNNPGALCAILRSLHTAMVAVYEKKLETIMPCIEMRLASERFCSWKFSLSECVAKG